jgi:hypothetical protein
MGDSKSTIIRNISMGRSVSLSPYGLRDTGIGLSGFGGELLFMMKVMLIIVAVAVMVRVTVC